MIQWLYTTGVFHYSVTAQVYAQNEYQGQRNTKACKIDSFLLVSTWQNLWQIGRKFLYDRMALTIKLEWSIHIIMLTELS